RNYVGGAGSRVGGGDVEHDTVVSGFEPALAAGQRGVKRTHEHDADNGLEGAQREFFAAREEITSGVVHEDVERAIFPDGVDHLIDCSRVTDIATAGVDGAARLLAQFGLGGGQDFVAAPTDVNSGAQYEEALSSRSAKTGAASRDENAFVLEQVLLEHGHRPMVCAYRL